MDLLSAIPVGLKVVGALVSLVAGLTALYTPTQENRLTWFGKGVLTALVIGALCSGSGAFLDYAAKQRDAATLKRALLNLVWVRRRGVGIDAGEVELAGNEE
jgi:hypothetical protein